MLGNQQGVRSVEATGLVKAEFDWVAFSITIRGNGDDSPSAKADARKAVDATKAVIDALEKQHGVTIDPDSMRLSFSVEPKQSYGSNGEQVHDGYAATYDIAFRTKDLSQASLIMDKLTEVKNVQVDAPRFHHDNPDAVYGQALAAARREVENKFAEECAVLGLNPEHFHLVSWEVRDGQRGGMRGKAQAIATAAISMASAPEPVQLEAGKAEISVHLTMNFAPSSSTTLANRKRGVVTFDPGSEVSAQEGPNSTGSLPVSADS